MKPFLRFLIIIGVGCYLSSCGMIRTMTKEESNIINQYAEDVPFRVLTVDNAEDLKVLKTPCTDVRPEDEATLKRLIARLKLTMEVEQGVGIAAPQVGISRNLFLFVRIDKPNMPVEVAINPKIVRHPEETVCFEGDGCLSVPGVSGNSVRYPWIEVEYTNEQGERVKEILKGYSREDDFTNIIFQHEFDHLKGVLYTEKLCD